VMDEKIRGKGNKVMKRLLVSLAVSAMALLLVGGALAASPRHIYRELTAKNGTIAQHPGGVSRNPTFQGYHKPVEPGPHPLGTTLGLRASGHLGLLPFTGLDLSLIAGGALMLVLVGSGLRILGRNKS